MNSEPGTGRTAAPGHALVWGLRLDREPRALKTPPGPADAALRKSNRMRMNRNNRRYGQRVRAARRLAVQALKTATQRSINALGYQVVRLDRHVGPTPLADMQRLLRTEAPLILDVGANEGQSIERFKPIQRTLT